jgi:hypothetical protein
MYNDNWRQGMAIAHLTPGELKTLNWILFVVDHLKNSLHVKNVDLLQHIVLTPNQNAIALIPELCLLSQSIWSIYLNTVTVTAGTFEP